MLTIQPEEAENKYVFKPVKLGNSDALKLGQSIVSIGGKESNVVLTGIISNLKIGELPTLTATSTNPIAEDKPKTLF